MTRTNRFLAALLILNVMIGVSRATLTPLWQYHETDYYTVIRFLITENRFPEDADYADHNAAAHQATHPPLYFLITAPIVALFDDAQPVPYGHQPIPLCLAGGEQANPVVTQYVTNQAYNTPFRGTVAAAYALRILNVLLGTVAVFFTFKAGQVLFPRQPIIALIGAAILALEPATFQFIWMINNDPLLLAVCAIQLYFMARALTQERLSWLDIVMLIGFSVAAPLVKLPGWASLAMAILVIAYRLVFRSRGRRVLLIALGLIAALTVVLALFNYQTYGSVLGRYSILDSQISSLLQTLNVPWVVVTSVADLTFGEFAGPLASLHPRAAFVNAYNAMLLLCFAGVVIAFAWTLLRRDWKQLRAYGLLAVFVIMTFVMVVLRNTVNASADNTTAYSTAMIFAPLRYYVPGLPPLAVLTAAGLGILLPRFSRGALGVIPAASFGVVSVAVVLMMAADHPTDPTIDPAVFASTPGITQVDLQAATDAPRIVGYSLQPQPDAGIVDLTLYMTLDSATETNFTGEVAFFGQPASPCEFLPTNGNYPTPRWQPGEIVVSTTHIPNCGADLAADTRLTIAWRGYTLSGESIGRTDAVTLASIDQPLARSQSCTASLGVIDGRFQLVKWNSPPEVEADTLYLPSVNWLTLDPSPAALRRVFQFTHEETGAAYTCLGTYVPVETWQRGETIYFDQCPMRFPPDAPRGTYSVSVGIQTLDEELLPALTPDGEAVNWLPAGQIEVR